MKNKFRKWIVMVAVIAAIGLSCCALCVIYLYTESKKPAETLEDLAYTKGRKGDNTIYLEEAGELTPYLVLEHDYADGGNVLLLGKELRILGHWNDGRADYSGSSIDTYLNGEFLERLQVKGEIRDTNILISSRQTKELEIINRNVFLLSAVEVGDYDKYLMLMEGKTLEYFQESKDRIAYEENGDAANWWLRTPDIMIYNNCVYVVGSQGGISSGDCNHNTNFVRPAFCLPPDLPVTIQELDGEMVYVVKEDE